MREASNRLPLTMGAKRGPIYSKHFFLGLAEAYGGTSGGASGGPTYVRRKSVLFIPASTDKKDKIANPLWKNHIDSVKRWTHMREKIFKKVR
jgi:hypothetical protein